MMDLPNAFNKIPVPMYDANMNFHPENISISRGQNSNPIDVKPIPSLFVEYR